MQHVSSVVSLLGFTKADAFGLDVPGQKMYAKETVYNAHLTSKKHVKAAAKLSADAAANSSGPDTNGDAAALATLRHNKNRALALKEALISALLSSKQDPPGPLAGILADTLANTERRLALTDKERQTEIEELEAREAAEAAAAADISGSRPRRRGRVDCHRRRDCTS